jgi:hypothetical protein
MRCADKLLRGRSSIVDHPVSPIKCRAGYRHFLLRGFDKVRGKGHPALKRKFFSVSINEADGRGGFGDRLGRQKNF